MIHGATFGVMLPSTDDQKRHWPTADLKYPDRNVLPVLGTCPSNIAETVALCIISFRDIPLFWIYSYADADSCSIMNSLSFSLKNGDSPEVGDLK